MIGPLWVTGNAFQEAFLKTIIFQEEVIRVELALK